MTADGDFEPIAFDENCAHCATDSESPIPDIEAIYCISVRQQPRRAAKAIAHFHQLGLCRAVLMYRPGQGVYPTRAIWRSHATVARHALANGKRRALIFEDDAHIRVPSDRLAARIAEAMARLPEDWWCLYLGHIPFQAYPVAPGVLRVRSGCLHAYIANESLLRWLDRTEPMDPTVPTSWLGAALDSAAAKLPGMYAVDPIVAVQRRGDELRPDAEAARDGFLRLKRFKVMRNRLLIYRLMQPTGSLVKLAGPIHRMTLERWRLRSDKAQLKARVIRESGLFDDDWYLRRYPDVLRADWHPLRHYIIYGGGEGRWPNPLFDPGYYRAAHADVGKCRLNPLLHYVTRGAYEGCNPNEMFDSAWYLAAYPEVARAQLNPLAHFAGRGWREGCNPSPKFDCSDYLSANSAARDSRINPLEHYLHRRPN